MFNWNHSWISFLFGMTTGASLMHAGHLPVIAGISLAGVPFGLALGWLIGNAIRAKRAKNAAVRS